MLGKSIRTRIQIWHTALLTCITCGLLVAFYFHEKEIREREFDNSLMAPITSLIPHVVAPRPEPPSSTDMMGRPPPRGPGGSTGSPPRMHRVEIEDESEEDRITRQNQAVVRLVEKGFYVVSMSRDGSFHFASSNAPEQISQPNYEPGREVRSAFLRTEGGNRECVHMAPGRSCVIVGADTSMLDADLVVLQWTLIIIGLTVIIFGFIVGWWLVGQSLKPIREISKAASEIAQGDLSKRIDLSETDSELGEMGGVLNDTFDKLESSFDQQVRFTADASHELRTPISVILAKCQFALRREREPEKYREALETCEASAQHIRSLVESLLELAKVDSGEFQVLKKDGDLKEVGESSLHLLSTLADEKKISVDAKFEPAQCNFDSDRLHQVAINLISNAIKYTKECGRITLRTYSQNNNSVLEVQDDGPGIDSQELPYLFDRFYRIDKERTDERRSTGLGLAISKAIVLAHGGEITVNSKVGEGSCFMVRIPA